MSCCRSARGCTLAGALILCGATACATHQTELVSVEGSPQRLWSPPLGYPDLQLLAGMEGSVLLRARVDTNGLVDRATIRVLESSNPAFEAPAVEMLAGSRFRPAVRAGAPTAVVVEVPVRFEIEEARQDTVAACDALAEGERLARAGSLDPAVAQFAEARRLDPRLASSPTIWWTLCWYGSLWEQARDFIGTCDRLVSLAPADVRARDARGFARALTGDFAGAIEDFEVVVAQSPSAGQRTERAAWVAILRAGRNPVTPEILERLRGRGP